jgi:hypothetical protein
MTDPNSGKGNAVLYSLPLCRPSLCYELSSTSFTDYFRYINPSSTLPCSVFIASYRIPRYFPYRVVYRTRGSVVVKALGFKLEGHGFQIRNFKFT